MNGSMIIFYVISAFLLTMAVLSVTSRKIFRSAIWLLCTLVGVAALYFWMEVEFIAAVQIAVYVGGIVVLIIFSIFLTQQSGKDMPRPKRKQAVFALLAAVFGLVFMCIVADRYAFIPRDPQPLNTSVEELGTQLLSTTEHGYILPFELVSMLLLAAMVGCIVIAMKEKKEPKEEGARLMIHSDFTKPDETGTI